MLLLLGKVWPVGGPLLVSSQRGKGPFGVGGNGVTPTRSSLVNPVPAGRGSVAKGVAVAKSQRPRTRKSPILTRYVTALHLVSGVSDQRSSAPSAVEKVLSLPLPLLLFLPFRRIEPHFFDLTNQ